MDYSHRTLNSARTSYPLRGSSEPPTKAAFLQGTQALLGTGLLEHKGEELLTGEQAFERHGFEGLLLLQDMQTAVRGIQMQDHPLASEARRDLVELEINTDLPVPVDFALQMQSVQGMQPVIRIHQRR